MYGRQLGYCVRLRLLARALGRAAMQRGPDRERKRLFAWGANSRSASRDSDPCGLDLIPVI